MDLPFTKMHGAGNDFVVLDAGSGGLQLGPDQIRAMADRHTGIGFDQLLVVTPADNPDCVAAYRIFNADGSMAEQCGNGARCVMAWLQRDGIVPSGETVHIDSPAGPVAMRIESLDAIHVDMGEPNFAPAACGFRPRRDDDDSPPYRLELGHEPVQVHIASLGNPHAVMEVDNLDDDALERMGPQLTHHPRFARDCNAGFVQCIDTGHLRLRVHERGAGWTQACGSGACAAAAVMIATGRCAERVRVELPGGTLGVAWTGPGNRLWLQGPAAFVFEGRWPLS